MAKSRKSKPSTSAPHALFRPFAVEGLTHKSGWPAPMFPVRTLVTQVVPSPVRKPTADGWQVARTKQALLALWPPNGQAPNWMKPKQVLAAVNAYFKNTKPTTRDSLRRARAGL
jgi:hypothetical protein